jgi:radical SAM superfamily enzyme YgiQ (UPF0313 family)
MEVGLESFNPAVLEKQGKSFNRVAQYKEQVKRFHDYGISLQAVMIFGFDEDTPDTFKYTLDALLDCKFDALYPQIYIPYPNTPSFEHFVKRGRLLTRNWDLYDGAHAVFRHPHFAPGEITDWCIWLLRHFYGFSNTVRAMKTIGFNSKLLWGIPFRQSVGRSFLQRFEEAGLSSHRRARIA